MASSFLQDSDEDISDQDSINSTDDAKRRQELLRQLSQPKDVKIVNQSKIDRYYDQMNSAEFLDESSSDQSEAMEADNSSDDEADFNGLQIAAVESSDSDGNCQNADDDNSHEKSHENSHENSCENSIENSKKRADEALSALSNLEFEKLLSHTMLNLAHKLELEDQNDQSTETNQSITNPFVSMDDEITLDTNIGLDMKELLSFIPDENTNSSNTNTNNTQNNEGFNLENVNNPGDFQSIVSFEKSHCVLPDPKTSSANHPSNLRGSKLTTTTLSDKDRMHNSFIREEIRLAEHTMKRAITRKTNIERKNFAPPLSCRDRRIMRKNKRENAGKGWFKMPLGKLTPENKMHFVMLKYRHMLYRDYKPAKMREERVPKFFQMGTIIEGPTEFYSDRLKKKERKSSWAEQFMNNPDTKQWLETKVERARKNIQAPRQTFWMPVRQNKRGSRKTHMLQSSGHRLRKRLQMDRKKNRVQAWGMRGNKGGGGSNTWNRKSKSKKNRRTLRRG